MMGGRRDHDQGELDFVKSLEIVHLRMAGEDLEALVKEIRRACDGWEDAAHMRMYRHGRLNSDLQIHLLHDAPGDVPQASDFGTHLASVLRIYGIVDHTVWLEAD